MRITKEELESCGQKEETMKNKTTYWAKFERTNNDGSWETEMPVLASNIEEATKKAKELEKIDASLRFLNRLFTYEDEPRERQLDLLEKAERGVSGLTLDEIASERA